MPGRVQVDLVHRPHEPVHRLEPVADQQRVEQHGAEHRQREQQQALAAGGVAQPVARDDGRDERGGADEQRVDGEDLGEERARAHPWLLSAIRPAPLCLYRDCRRRGARLNAYGGCEAAGRTAKRHDVTSSDIDAIAVTFARMYRPLWPLHTPLLPRQAGGRPFSRPRRGHPARVRVLEEVAARGLIHLGHDEFAADVDAATAAALGEPVLVRASADGDELEAFVRLEGGASRVARLRLRLARPSRSPRRAHETVAAELERLRGALPTPEPEEDEVPCAFWAPGRGAPPRRRRRGEWADLRSNYAAATAAGLDALMDVREPERGRLLLWHGAPGTGKTHALRALARAWRAVVLDALHPRPRRAALAGPALPARRARVGRRRPAGELLRARGRRRARAPRRRARERDGAAAQPHRRAAGRGRACARC